MGHRRTALIYTSLLTATALSMSAAVQGAPVDVIYAAENALYGQGYDIGEADGWLDDKLRAAIRTFQSDQGGLQSNGNLDQATLKALSIESAEGEISDNQLSSPGAAIAKLGLAGSHQAAASTTRKTVAAASARESKPEPKPEPKAKAQPTPETKLDEPRSTQADDQPLADSTASDTAQQSIPETQPEPASQAKTAKIREPAPEPKTAPKPKPESKPKPSPEPEQASKPETASATARKSDQTSDKTDTMARPEPDEKPAAKPATPDVEEMAQPEKPANATGAESPRAPDNQMADNGTPQNEYNTTSTEEPATAPSQPPTDEESQKDSESSGGFFSWLFDFLFGWI